MVYVRATSILFSIAFDFVMIAARMMGNQWTDGDNYMGYFDFADEICLINSRVEEMRGKKTNRKQTFVL